MPPRTPKSRVVIQCLGYSTLSGHSSLPTSRYKWLRPRHDAWSTTLIRIICSAFKIRARYRARWRTRSKSTSCLACLKRCSNAVIRPLIRAYTSCGTRLSRLKQTPFILTCLRLFSVKAAKIVILASGCAFSVTFSVSRPCYLIFRPRSIV
jgi:hypothetical protein